MTFNFPVLQAQPSKGTGSLSHKQCLHRCLQLRVAPRSNDIGVVVNQHTGHGLVIFKPATLEVGGTQLGNAVLINILLTKAPYRFRISQDFSVVVCP